MDQETLKIILDSIDKNGFPTIMCLMLMGVLWYWSKEMIQKLDDIKTIMISIMSQQACKDAAIECFRNGNTDAGDKLLQRATNLGKQMAARIGGDNR